MGVSALERTPAQRESDSRDWSFGGTWPYRPSWLLTDGIRLHYVDEGPRDGEPVLLLHGSPTWSYVYRRFVHGLQEAGYRAIAYDQLGFGRSDKPRRARDYSLERHGRHLAALVEELELDDVILVVQDWGGPIGLGWAAAHPERVARLVLLNTFAEDGPGAKGLFRAPLTSNLLVKGTHFYVRAYLLRAELRYPERLSADERAAYLAPHPSWSSRSGILAYARSRHRVPDVSALAAKPALLLWGPRDRALGGSVRRWEELLPHADVVELDSAGHFLQEDAPDESFGALLDFLRRTS
jgi:pimeloyl-ACP methyl ester carboxylesterase